MSKFTFVSVTIFAISACIVTVPDENPNWGQTSGSNAANSSQSTSDVTVSDTGTATSTTATTATTPGSTSMETGDASCDKDLICEDWEDENLETCLHDCGTCDENGTCDPATETPYSCPEDCGTSKCILDGKVDALSEQCDDGNDIDTDECTSECKKNVCGDGHINNNAEECDDGNDIDTDNCTSACTNASCGDGHVQGTEECDVGVMNSNTGACLDDCTKAECGDGHVQAGVEECDLGMNNGPGGGCVTCGLERTVFVTSTLYSGNLGGLAGADNKCQVRAGTASLTGTFRAWLSDGANGPADLLGLAQSQGPFVLTDGTVVANNWADLTDGSLLHAIDMDETGNGPINSNVWTGTEANGTPVGSENCMSWNDGDQYGWPGSSTKTDEEWSKRLNGQFYFCNSSARLYCFQVE